MNQAITTLYGRDTSMAYYDCTNYYFEIHNEDEPIVNKYTNELDPPYRMRGLSKEKRKTTIVQMGLLMDNNGIPMSYDMFLGNKSEIKSLVPILKRAKRQYHLPRIVVVADRGLNNGDNIFETIGKGDGYIYSKSVLGASAEFKAYVTNQDTNTKSFQKLQVTYTDESGTTKTKDDDVCVYMIKSRIHPEELTYTDSNGKKKKAKHDQKQVVFWSKNYADKAKHERNKAIEKAKKLIANKSKYTKSTTVGATSYIKDIKFSRETGEILNSVLELDIEKIKREASYDGYYAITSSEFKMSDEKIIENYRGLWKIEESFRITKTELHGRPEYVSDKEHIGRHLLTCFVPLTIIRLIEHQLEKKHNVSKLIESLKKFQCTHVYIL